ncbi:MAG: hypothetical protein HS101_17040 [Planctomycetia bacterium]|nr:hypothetical protein [Planctomycetia bacterium]
MNVGIIRGFIGRIARDLADVAIRLESRAGSPVGGLFIPGAISETGRATILVNVGDGPSEAEALAVVVHELAHYATDRTPTSPPVSAEDIDLRREVARRAMDGVLPEPKMPYDRHEADFIRCLIHLWVRSDALGYRFTAQSLFPHGHYQLSDLFGYLRALGDEPTRMARLTLHEIQQIEPPDDFSELWREDVAAVELSQKERKNMASGSIFDRLRRREVARTESLYEIAAALARGDDRDPKTVEAVLADAGKTVEDLEQLTEQFRQRHAKREHIRDAEQLQKEGRQLETQLAAIDEAHERAILKWEETRDPIIFRLGEIQRAQSAADTFRAELLTGTPAPELSERQREAHDRHNRLDTRARELRALVAANRRERESAEHTIKRRQGRRIPMSGYVSAGHVDSEQIEDQRIVAVGKLCESRATRYAADLAGVEKELQAAERECAEIDAQVAAS